MEKTEKQRAAHQLIGDYMKFMSEQESVVERIVDKKLAQMEPLVRQIVEQYLKEKENPLTINQ